MLFERLQKPFLTVETGEAYQPVRLTYLLKNKEQFLQSLEKIQCLQKNVAPNSWTWYWKGECNELHFESIDAFKRDSAHLLRLGTLMLREDKVYLNLPSFKRACLAVPLFHKLITQDVAMIEMADFINKVFALDERLPHGFTELFKEEELNKILNQRIEDYHKIKEQCEQAPTAEAAFSILSEYTHSEAQKRLPYAERYIFDLNSSNDVDLIFLAFYIFLRGRELVAIKRWFGQAGYSLADAADETIDEVFGGIGIDIIE